MRNIHSSAGFAVLVSLTIGASSVLTGCATEDFVRVDGVTTGAGDAIASNTVLQMVDPWPRGVDDTDLRVPAERPVIQPLAADDGGLKTQSGGASSYN